jgi:hypothetical protein
MKAMSAAGKAADLVPEQSWISRAKKTVIVEIGAGTDLPTLRRKGENLQAPMVRINPVDADIGSGKGVGLRMGALDALKLLASQRILPKRPG